MVAGTAIMLCVALIAVIVATSTDSRSHQVKVVATTAGPTSVHDATERDFPDLPTLRAWLAPTIARSASAPASVHAQIARSSIDVYSVAIGTDAVDRTPIYLVQLTGTDFVCPCEAPGRVGARALVVA